MKHNDYVFCKNNLRRGRDFEPSDEQMVASPNESVVENYWLK